MADLVYETLKGLIMVVFVSFRVMDYVLHSFKKQTSDAQGFLKEILFGVCEGDWP